MTLTNPRILVLKALLFLVAGVMAVVAILIELPSARIALLLALVIWCFARAYYFAFYVIEKYIDPGYRFAGIVSAVKYVLRRGRTSGTA